jgi:hypothetical protein
MNYNVCYFSAYQLNMSMTSKIMRRAVTYETNGQYFVNSLSGGVESSWVHSARRPLIGLLYLPRVIMMMETLVE